MNAQIEDLTGWVPPHGLMPDVLTGRFARLERLAAHHLPLLYDAFAGADTLWDYMICGPYASCEAFCEEWTTRLASVDPHFYAIIDMENDTHVGVAAYLRNDPKNGVIEVGHLTFSPAMQRSRLATEAMFLMMAEAFRQGYRRYEWKCNASNAASRAAAQRFGFSFEGVFRQMMIVKGRNRDTAWFSMLDHEWPAIKTAFHTWLADDNFDGGQQKHALRDMTAPLLAAIDPQA